MTPSISSRAWWKKPGAAYPLTPGIWAWKSIVQRGFASAEAGLTSMLGFEAIDVYDVVRDVARRAPIDLVVANAFLDLVDAPRLLPGLLALLRPGGHFWFTLNFDGLTVLEPALEPGFDEDVIALYHDSMDRRVVDGLPSGSCRTGRCLFRWLKEAGGHDPGCGKLGLGRLPLRGKLPGGRVLLPALPHRDHGARPEGPSLDRPGSFLAMDSRTA